MPLAKLRDAVAESEAATLDNILAGVGNDGLARIAKTLGLAVGGTRDALIGRILKSARESDGSQSKGHALSPTPDTPAVATQVLAVGNNPSVIGAYKVLARLGQGSYGTVYKVEDEDRNHWALKWQRPGADEEGRGRFENEVWALKRIDHHAVPEIRDSRRARGPTVLRHDAGEGRVPPAHVGSAVQGCPTCWRDHRAGDHGHRARRARPRTREVHLPPRHQGRQHHDGQIDQGRHPHRFGLLPRRRATVRQPDCLERRRCLLRAPRRNSRTPTATNRRTTSLRWALWHISFSQISIHGRSGLPRTYRSFRSGCEARRRLVSLN